MRSRRAESVILALCAAAPVPIVLALGSWQHSSHAPAWIEWVPFLPLELSGAALLIGRTIIVRRRLRAGDGKFCPRCGYSLAALDDRGVCPECGRGFDFAEVRGAWNGLVRFE